MNNTISPVNNMTFNARYLKLIDSEKFPRKIYDAIYKSDAVDKFIRNEYPESLWDGIKDLFKKDETLEVFYETKKTSQYDPFSFIEKLIFTLNRGKRKERVFELQASQSGALRPFGTIVKEGEHEIFTAPKETATDKLAEQIEQIKDLDSMLKSSEDKFSI